MKRLLIVLFLLSQTIFSFGQDIKTKKKKVNTQEGKSVFYVLSNNETIKHGEFQITGYSGNRILLKGLYENNKKVGLWKEQYYGKEYKGPKATGYYDNDLKVGEWVYFDYSGDTAQIYNWTTNKLIYSKSFQPETKEYIIIEEGKESKSKLDFPPTCISGLSYFLYEFVSNLGDYTEYFNEPKKGLFEFKNRISVTIDESSSVKEISYSVNEKPELKKIIEKYIKSFNWLAGIKDGKPVTSKLEFSVNFANQF